MSKDKTKDAAPAVSNGQIANATEALRQSVHKIHQIAKHYAPQFIELARGTHLAHVPASRPGMNVVSRLIGMTLLADVQGRLLKRLLIDAGVIDSAEFERQLALEVEATALQLSVEINGNSADFLRPFEFTPVPDAPPTRANDGNDG